MASNTQRVGWAAEAREWTEPKQTQGKLFLFVLFFLRVNSFNTLLEIMETAFIYDDSRVTAFVRSLVCC